MKKLMIVILLLLMASIASANILDDAADLQHKVKDFIGGKDDALIIRGSYASSTEKLALFYLQRRYPDIKEMETIKDTEFTSTGKTLVLIGGPYQNSVARQILNDSSYSMETDNISIGKIGYLTSSQGKAIILSDNAGYTNLPRTNHITSPLAKYIPEEAVPLAATAIGLSLLWLWQFFSKLFNKIIKALAARNILKRAKKDKRIKERYAGITLLGLRIKYREWLSILAAAIIFAVSISYGYFTDNITFMNVLKINLAANIIIYTIRNLVKLLMDKHHKTHTEYHIWFFGALITLLSGWLGNTFSLAGYNITEGENQGKAKYFVNLLTFMAGLAFFIWNLLEPSIVKQMVTVLLVSLGFLRMLPIDPMGGEKIYKWNKKVWKMTFMPLAVLYVVVNLIV